jgi:hypothetical protein
MPGVLDLPDGPHSRVWLKTLEILQADEVLARTVRTWEVPDGNTDVIQGTSATPTIRLEPSIGGLDWWSEDAHFGYLLINIRFIIQSRDATDRLNLFGAFVNAIYPYGKLARQLEIQQALRDAGAQDTGQYEFNIPPSDPEPRSDEDGKQVCDGQMRIQVVWGFNP